jgi:hypothetical protein
MKFKWSNLTLAHYVRHMRKQSRHMQHAHAFVFAGVITGAIAIFILYGSYGFWHERYVAEDPALDSEGVPFDPESPSEALMGFFEEAKERFGSIRASGSELLEGKETYRTEE